MITNPVIQMRTQGLKGGGSPRSPAPLWCQNWNPHLPSSDICEFAFPHYTLLLGWLPQSILGLFRYSLEWFPDVSWGEAVTLPFLGTGHSQCWEGGEVLGENRRGVDFLSLQVGGGAGPQDPEWGPKMSLSKRDLEDGPGL